MVCCHFEVNKAKRNDEKSPEYFPYTQGISPVGRNDNTSLIKRFGL